MIERVLADAVVALHLGFIVFVILGGLAVVVRPAIAWLHIPAVLWGAYAEFTSTICPLTPIENALRVRAGQAGYEGSFIEHYVVPLIYPPGLTARSQVVIGAIVVAVNVSLYVIAWRHAKRTSMRRLTS